MVVVVVVGLEVGVGGCGLVVEGRRGGDHLYTIIQSQRNKIHYLKGAL